MKFKTILCLLALGIALTTYSQEKGFPIRILLGNQATAIPFNKFWSRPLHPTFQLGTEFRYNIHAHHYLYQTVNVGYIYHEHLYQGAYLNSELGYDYRMGFGLSLKTLFGVGYLHTVSTEEEYQFEDGQYSGGKDVGNSRVMPSLSIGLGFRTHGKNSNSPEIMVLYRSWVEFPYSPGFISLMSHTDLGVGIKFYIN